MTPEPTDAPETMGSHDGDGAGDHDVPFRFGWRPRVDAVFPFSTRQYARLLVLRSQIRAGVVGSDDWGPLATGLSG